MKFGVNSLLFTDSFVEKNLPLIEYVHGLGFDLFEITPVEPDRYPAKEVRRIAAELGMTINMNFAMPVAANPLSSDPKVRERSVELSKQVIDLCNEAGAEIYCGANYCPWGHMTGTRRTDDEWKYGVETYRTIAEYAQANSALIFGVETLNRFESYFINTAADAVRFCADVGMPNVTVHLDTFHMIREEDNIGDAIRATGPKLGYFHACGSQRGIPGRDMVPWVETFTALRDVGYDYAITIESFNPNLESIAHLVAIWRDFADSPEQLATEGLAFVRQMTEQYLGASSLPA